MKYTLLSLIILLTIISCNTTNELATYHDLDAITITQYIKDHGLVVIFPTDHKKESALESMMKTIPSLSTDLEDLRTKRAETLDLWLKLKSIYTFSSLSIIPDSIMKDYLIDPTSTFVVNDQGVLEKATDLGTVYAFYTEYGGYEIKQHDQFIPNPFPNKVGPAMGSAIRNFLGVQPEEKNVKRFFSILNSNLLDFSWKAGTKQAY